MSIKRVYNQIKSKQDGVVVIITVLFVAFMISIVVGLASIILPRLRVSAEIKRSVGALYAADSAIEWCLYRLKADVPGPIMLNDSSYVLVQQEPIMPNCSDAGAGPVQAIGTYQGVTRSLEASGF